MYMYMHNTIYGSATAMLEFHLQSCEGSRVIEHCADTMPAVGSKASTTVFSFTDGVSDVKEKPETEGKDDPQLLHLYTLFMNSDDITIGLNCYRHVSYLTHQFLPQVSIHIKVNAINMEYITQSIGL